MSFDAVLRHVSPRARAGACSCAQTGAMERSNPLPAGRYWVDVFAKDSGDFDVWLKSNTATVRVLSTEHFDTEPSRDWILFQVSAPTVWNGPGFPTIADESVTSSSDTAARPPPAPDVTTQLADAASSAASFAASWKPLAIGLGAVAVILLLRGKHG